MSNEIVSQTYFDACERIHRATDMLYESLHNEEGTQAVRDYEEVLSNNEIDLIREMCKESDQYPF